MLKAIWKSMSLDCPRKVVVIVGTTGVGKSQLSIQLAKRFNGEVINSDSMQVYKKLPIITNKHPIEEREGIHHHVMNHVDWSEEYYLHRFEKECVDAIEDIHKRGKLAIIVGGTHYYLQVLFNKRIKKLAERHITKEERELLNSGNNQLIYDTLKNYDTTIAAKFHPNDIRRVRRMLEIYYETGQRPSETYAEQKTSMRYDTLFLWLYSDPDLLEKRLDYRVDKMLQAGAMEEIRELHNYFRNQNYTMGQCENGIWQVIGFKEFLPWLEDDNNTKIEEGVERMKIRTRQYAKKQIKWIRKMLVPDVNGAIYVLDASDLSQWNEKVLVRSADITEQFVEDTPIRNMHAPGHLAGLIEKSKDTSQRDWKQYICNICHDKSGKELIAIGEINWQIHLKSRRHRSSLSKAMKRTAYKKWKDREGETN